MKRSPIVKSRTPHLSVIAVRLGQHFSPEDYHGPVPVRAGDLMVATRSGAVMNIWKHKFRSTHQGPRGYWVKMQWHILTTTEKRVINAHPRVHSISLVLLADR